MRRRDQPLTRLVDANPKWWVTPSSAPHEHYGISFDCPIHEDCGRRVSVPFINPIGTTPAQQGWNRTGEDFGTLTLTPSIKNIPHAHDDGCDPECPGDPCAWHGFVTNGELIACADSQ